ISRPKMRAVPEVGLWKPRSELIRVDLPAPFGPRSPMERPVREAFRPLRIVRDPKRTSSPSNSMTGGIPLFKRRGVPGGSPDWGEGNGVLQIAGDEIGRADAHEVTGGGDADAIGLAVSGDHRRFHIAEHGQRVVIAAVVAAATGECAEQSGDGREG